MEERQFTITEDLLASKWKRLLNNLIDLIPQYAVLYGLAFLFYYIGEFTGNYALNDYWNSLSKLEDYIFIYAIMIGYYFLMENITSRTLGKYVTNTMVVLHNGEKPSNQEVFKRTLCRIIPFDGLSFLGTNGKGWHDSMSKTYVVDVDKFDLKKNTTFELELIGKPEEEL